MLSRLWHALRDWHLAVAVGAAFFVLYLLTLCPTVYWYDSAEFVTASATLGIPHPPGYPLYTLFGRLFVLLPVNPALAVNLMSAVFGAVSVALCYATARELGARRPAAVTGAALLGAAPLFWSQAVVAEVYTPGLSFLLGALLLLLRGVKLQRGSYVLLAGLVAGLGLGMHLFIATCGLGFALLVIGMGLEIRGPRELRRLVSGGQWKRRSLLAGAALLAAALGSCIFLYLPLRAGMGPALNVGNPSTWEGFRWVVTGGEYRHWFAKTPSVGVGELSRLLYDQLFVVGVALAGLGLWRLFRERALIAVSLLLMAAGNVWFFRDYRVHDWQVFFLPTAALLCLLAALGAEELLRLVERHTPSGRSAAAALTAQVVLLLFPMLMVALTYRSVDMSAYRDAERYGADLCRELPRNARILHFTSPEEWKYNAVFADYYQKVLRRRRDVRVVNVPSLKKTLALLRSGAPVYLYHPMPKLRRWAVLRREGRLHRLVRFRRRPLPP